ncbi:uncharacterized protein LOC143183538 [Calliopsis andreniformis]|uniref:uncharacterized protein LOC143183538 n=1 Tax=Calliopsis andreniformis TaxID=337506 RepID=UPI003FCCA824
MCRRKNGGRDLWIDANLQNNSASHASPIWLANFLASTFDDAISSVWERTSTQTSSHAKLSPDLDDAIRTVCCFIGDTIGSVSSSFARFLIFIGSLIRDGTAGINASGGYDLLLC